MCWGVGDPSFFHYQICDGQKCGWSPLHGSQSPKLPLSQSPQSVPMASSAHSQNHRLGTGTRKSRGVRHTLEAASAGGAPRPHPDPTLLSPPAEGTWLPPWSALKSPTQTNTLRHPLTSQEALGLSSADVRVWGSTLRRPWVIGHRCATGEVFLCGFLRQSCPNGSHKSHVSMDTGPCCALSVGYTLSTNKNTKQLTSNSF